MIMPVQYIANKHKSFNNCVIVCDGNSLTVGQGSTGGNNYPSQMGVKYPLSSFAGSITNKGVGGQTTLDMEADATSDIDSLLSGSYENILLAWEIRNHLVVDAPTNSDAYDAFADYCSERQAAGWKVIVATILPSWAASYRGDNTSTGYAQLESDRNAVNVMLRNGWGDFADGLADLAAVSSIGTFGNHENTGYVFNTASRPTTSTNGLYDDGTHMTNAGYTVVADVFLKSIWKLF